MPLGVCVVYSVISEFWEDIVADLYYGKRDKRWYSVSDSKLARRNIDRDSHLSE
jgi:hypothetical protein